MSEEVEVRIIGIERIDNALRGMNEIDRNKAIKSGLRKGAQLLRKGGIRRLKERMKKPEGVTGNLLKAFQIKVKKNKIGALAGFGMALDDQGGRIKVGHAYIVDEGTKERTRSDNRSTGKGPALHYWTDTKNEDMGAAMEATFTGVEDAMIKIMTA
jgi:hypothetical protein